MKRPFHILTICTANLCRSPAMEILLRDALPAGVTVSSAGVEAEEGRPIDRGTATVLGKRNLADDSFRSRRLRAALLSDVDLVLTATLAHRSDVVELRPAILRRTFTLLELADLITDEPAPDVETLLSRAAAHRHRSTGERNVDDPYRQGHAVQQEVISVIDRAIAVIAPALSATLQPGP